MALKSVSIQYDDFNEVELLDAFCKAENYQEQVVANPQQSPPEEPIFEPNPETKGQFFKRRLREWTKQRIQAGQQVLADEAAMADRIAPTDIPLT
jgi:hypothetical protein